MNNKIPDDKKKVKISLSIDPELNRYMDEIIKNKFYKKSRFIDFLIRKYINDDEKR
jgi:metal-responsive CopG/Arc/MetJ family transcriptional regulator